MSQPWSETLSFENRHTNPPSNRRPQRTPIWDTPSPTRIPDLAGISVRAFALGATFSLGFVGAVLTLTLTNSPLWRIPFFLCALSAFHFLEFWTTATANKPHASIHSFLLTANWPAYPIAHATACVECFITNMWFPDRSWAPFHMGTLLLVMGLVMVFGGQVVRSKAMLVAGENFNHVVQTSRASGHVLVTTGVYRLWRHPSYFGFFYWGLGTQLVMGNVVCFVGYGLVLWKFFSSRVKVEEKKLVEFFGDEYVEYRKRVGTMIPFVG